MLMSVLNLPLIRLDSILGIGLLCMVVSISYTRITPMQAAESIPVTHIDP